MADSLLFNGIIHSPFFIFVRCAGEYSDAELLRRFGISNNQLTESKPRFLSYVCITDDGKWTHIADDWSYTLWHMESTRDVIAEIGRDHDVFACSVGESDQSWDFVYYRHGRLLRKYVVEDPDYRGGTVTEDHGIPLEGEEEARKHADEQETVLAIATSLGIDVRHEDKKIRVYANSRAKR